MGRRQGCLILDWIFKFSEVNVLIFQSYSCLSSVVARVLLVGSWKDLSGRQVVWARCRVLLRCTEWWPGCCYAVWVDYYCIYSIYQHFKFAKSIYFNWYIFSVCQIVLCGCQGVAMYLLGCTITVFLVFINILNIIFYLILIINFISV